MKENINKADSVLQRLSIIEKVQLLSWSTEVDFGDGIAVNVDKSGTGTERFRLTRADIDGVYGYPISSFYGPQDADALSCWGGGNVPVIERDADSAELERLLDEGLRRYGIDKDNPVVQRYHKGNPEAVTFEGTAPTD